MNLNLSSVSVPRTSMWRIVLLLLALCGRVFGQGEGLANEQQKKLRSFLDDTCNGFEIVSKNDNTKTTGQVVFRWDNRSRGSADGCTALWYDSKRRPIAIASVFPIRETLHHDFDLIDRRAGAIGKLNGKEFWRTSNGAKFEFKPVAGAPTPALTEKARRIQMKLLAKQHSVELQGWRRDDSDRETLRMLPTPVHRYGEEKSDVIDGAVFLFVQGVDPEAGLLIEAHKHQDSYRWEYAFIPQTSASLEAKHKRKVVWKKSRDQLTPSHGYVAREIPADARVR